MSAMSQDGTIAHTPTADREYQIAGVAVLASSEQERAVTADLRTLGARRVRRVTVRAIDGSMTGFRL